MSRQLPIIFGAILVVVFFVFTLLIAPSLFGELEATGDANLTNSSQYHSVSAITLGAITFLTSGGLMIGAIVLILSLYVLRRA